ncbi:hypothetical protein P389DRAFT_186860 [Cystobasidium minutum MCA 4210]|uniref:uncharacterized protein n=1 Tax=Cystobasidium minutum MCA 4210 TaxID=1397322 RepID=UPI0034CFBC8C|eukprot:jgi/Rhomi1/186860/estExt_fgenesh1_pg.C_1_t10095
MARASGGQVRKKKGEAGAAKNYITRTQAIKKLQCSMSDFRRLCILKGIYPRQPRNHKKANKGSTAPASFYYVKDIQYLLHEPVLQKLREHKTFAKKLSRAIGRGEWSTAKSLEEDKKPKYRLDHIVKERYPSFPDAVRDMDDALSLIVLFAHLPATEKIPATIVANCSKLAAEWQLYVMRTRSLRKVFLSVKGIYFQANVKGEIITWLVPYMFTQNIPSDIDFRVMMTFLELYQTVLGFVLFRLYHEINLNYPPKLDASKDDAGAGIGALLLEETSRTLTIEGKKGTEEGLHKDGKKVSAKDVKKQIRQITHHSGSAATNGATATIEEEGDESMAVELATTTSSKEDIPKSLDESEVSQANQTTDEELTNLFSDYYFYLSREVTRPTLEFVIRSFGGQVGWDATLGAGSPYTIDDPRITHHVIDRPVPLASTSKGSAGALVVPGLNGAAAGKRAYIQPQWVVDCINLRKILPTDQYAPGKVLPPHLSPFVDYDQVRKQGGYIPTEAGGEDVELSEDDEEEDEEDEEEEAAVEGEGASSEMEADENEEAAEAEEVDEEEEFTGFGGEEAEDDDSQPRPALLAAASNPDDASLMHQAELEAESHGIPYSTFESELSALKKTLAATKADTKTVNKAALEAASHSAKTQEANPASILLSNKQRKLYNKMKFGENRRNEEAEKLRAKKKMVAKKEKKSKA